MHWIASRLVSGRLTQVKAMQNWKQLKQLQESRMSDAELGKLTVKELRELRDRVDNAIRASIAKSRMASQQPADATTAPSLFDLERERDAFLSRR